MQPGSSTQGLGLGTVQFGLDYGISNDRGKMTLAEARQIMECAASEGIEYIDTAALYGDAESVIGSTLPLNHRFRIVTKSPHFHVERIGQDEADALVSSFEQSLVRLRQRSLYGLHVHRADDLLKPGGERLVDAMRELKAKRLVERIGTSVYSGEQIERILGLFTPDIIQLPFNLLDQRLVANGMLKHLKQRGVEIHGRSVFLQGLLLMDPNRLDSFFDPMKDNLWKYRRALEEAQMSPIEGALQFVLSQPEIDVVVVGVCSTAELQEILNAFRRGREAHLAYADFAVNDDRFVNPSKWSIR